MATGETKTLARRFFEEVFNTGDAGAAAVLLSPAFVTHHPAFPEGIQGVEGTMQIVGMFRAGFSDLHYVTEDLIAEDDRVAVRWIARGTHNGPFMGVAASGRAVIVTGTDIFRVADGQLAEAWVNSDFLGLMQQIGAIPTCGGAPI